MAIGIISITLAIMAILPCLAPGAMSAIGVFISLFALLMSCLTTIKGKAKYLLPVLFIVTLNIFVVSEFSFSLSKKLYSHAETPLRKIIHKMTYTEVDRIKQEKSKQALENYLGYELVVNYKRKEEGYWQFVRMVGLIIFFPYLVSFYHLYNILQKKTANKNLP